MNTTVPTKTASGNDELRQRTHRLGQRHRTILFLIDGRRTLHEVLHLAEQAGASAAHFDELLQLGLVELPAPPPPQEEAPPQEPGEAHEAASAETAEQEIDDLWTETVSAPQSQQQDQPVQHAESVRHIEPVEPAAPAAPAEHAVSAPVPSAAAPVAVPAPPPPVAQPQPVPSEPPTPEDAEVDLLPKVREHLIETLRLDAPLFSARTFMRVRNAQSSKELIQLVWEIEGHLTRARHTRRELLSLQRARELLGLGNTLIHDDTRPPHLEE